MVLKKITCWILQSAYIFSALIAILTSAVVTLLSGGIVQNGEINYWLLAGTLIAAIAIGVLSRVLGMAQAVDNRAITLNEENGQTGEDTIEDAFVHVLHLKQQRNNKMVTEDEELLKENERHLLLKVCCVIVLIVSLVVVSWKGSATQQKMKMSNITKSVIPSVDSLRNDYMRLNNSLIIHFSQTDNRIDSLQIKMEKILEATTDSPKSPRKQSIR